MSAASSLVADGVATRQRSLNRRNKYGERSSGAYRNEAEKKGQLIDNRSAQSQHDIRFHLYHQTFIAFVMLAVLCTALYFSNHRIFTVFIDQPNNLSVQSLDRTLHPDDHVSRAASTINIRWRVGTGLRSPDGVTKRVYLINDEFLGPTIEARSGDILNVEVINELPDEGFAIHWHGLYMRGWNEMDGAVGMTQEAILPGQNFTYHFKIAEEQAGTFWYHAHSQVQRGDGLFGALIVHRPADMGKVDRMSYDEERLLVINDWYHRPADQALSWYMRAGSFGMEPVPDSILINGVGSYNCSKAVPARPIKCSSTQAQPVLHMDVGKTYRFRIINTGMLAGFSIKMNEAELTVFEVDGGTEVDSLATSSIGILYPGQRVDVIVGLKSVAGQNLTVSLDREGFRYPNPALTTENTFQVLLSGHFHAGENFTASVADNCDLQQLQSHHTHDLPSKPDMTMVLYTTTLKLARLSNVPYGFINHTSWKPQSPPLIDLSRSEYDAHQFVPFIPYQSRPLWIDIVLNNLDDDHHPFHLHGYSPYILQSYASGSRFGSWNPFESSEPPGGTLNLVNPMSRDTFIVPRKGYIVLRIRADNPGIWLFHCHVLWHLGSGMAMGIEVERFE